MLLSLSIKNFVLIDNLQINFDDGLSIITGETGAGKSILLGALGLVLGDRADTSKIKNTSQKCVIEAVFNVKNYNLKSFFADHDLDYDENTIIRREVLPQGKSRAFINDTPINLNHLQHLKSALIDIHSQQDTAKLNELDYQFQIIDGLAKTEAELNKFTKKLNRLKKLSKELEALKELQKNKQLAYDYNLYIFNELEKAKLKTGEFEALETEIEKLEHIDSIGQSVKTAIQLTETDEVGLRAMLQKYKLALENIAQYDANCNTLKQRIQSLLIEFDDLHNELLNYQEQINLNPQTLAEKQERFNLLNNLLQKHQLNNINELLIKQNALEADLKLVENADQELKYRENEIDSLKSELLKIGDKIHQKRIKILPKLKNDLENQLAKLGMQKARFAISLNKEKNFYNNGTDNLAFLFSANQGTPFGKITKVASGGELSRIMLAIKAILSKYNNLPTIIFDEIDAGVSGEVANNVAQILKFMAGKMQVLAISHLPQIAAKGKQHFKVYKQVKQNETLTLIKLLNTNERIDELAEMLGGKNKSHSAILHAKALLQ